MKTWRLNKLPTLIIASLTLMQLWLFYPLSVTADQASAMADALTYLKANQTASGQINGFGGVSQWAAIAFAANGVDVATVHNPTTSLKDFLLSDQPASTAAATEWERRILAIAAIGEDPTNFGGLNYVAGLKTHVNSGQIGDASLLNDDIFGLLALAGAHDTDIQLQQTLANFIIAHQNSDGGFSYTTVAPFNGSDSNDTAAALQALQAAKNAGQSQPSLDSAISSATNYLLSTQKADGGFGYDSFSDADGSSTAWALIALNALDQTNSAAASAGRNWLLANQLPDGGFGYLSIFGSDTYTTSHALVALSGQSWLLKTAPASAPITVPTPTSQLSTTESPQPAPPTADVQTDAGQTSSVAVAVDQATAVPAVSPGNQQTDSTAATQNHQLPLLLLLPPGAASLWYAVFRLLQLRGV